MFELDQRGTHHDMVALVYHQVVRPIIMTYLEYSHLNDLTYYHKLWHQVKHSAVVGELLLPLVTDEKI